MSHKQLLFRAGARTKILRGASILAHAVRVTLGPKSKCVLIERKWGAPLVCNDGVTIAKEIDLKDPEENLGARMIRQAAEQTADAVGDGTSTSTILAHAILAEGIRNVTAGANAIDLKQGIERALREAVRIIREQSKPVKARREKAQIATISAQLETLTLEELGKAQRIVVDKDNTTIIGGKGNKAAIQGRCAELRKQLEKSTSDYDKEKLRERLAKLAGGVAVIRVGAPSEAQMKSQKEALEDAISATQAAIAEGIVPCAGLTLLRAIDAVEKLEKQLEGDERTGLAIMKRALEAPTRQIADNSAADPGVVLAKMRAGTDGFGFDAAAGKYTDLTEAGIIDPTKVVRLALENAVFVAATLLLSEATLTELPESNAHLTAAAPVAAEEE